MKKSLLILILAGILFNAKSQDEYQAKAFFIYNFTRLIEWPPSSNGEFVIGILGRSPIVPQLEKLTSGKLIGSQKIVIRQFSSVEEIQECKILFVSNSASSKITAIQSSVQNQNTLIVGEKNNLLEQGAAISFVLSNNRLSFQINVDNATKQGLKVSKSLVDMAS